MAEDIVGFWSYVHADDDGDGGRILTLAERLKEQFRMVTSEPLTLFKDTDIGWGEEWATRINNAIAGTTFLIPIITPSYFKSRACRDELMRFTREADRLGLQQLVRAIYWVTVPELENEPKESPDEAVRIIGRYQWRDLRDARLEDEGSSVFRKAVSVLATELAARATSVETIRDVPEPVVPTVSEEDDDEPGLLEHMVTAQEVTPELAKILVQAGEQMERVTAATQTADGELRLAKPGDLKRGLIVTERYAAALGEPAAELERLGSEYAAKLSEVDPSIRAEIEAKSAADIDDPDRGAYLESIRGLAHSSDGAAAQLEGMVSEADKLARFSRSLRQPIRRLRTGLRNITDGRDIISEWGRLAEAADSDRGE